MASYLEIRSEQRGIVSRVSGEEEILLSEGVVVTAPDVLDEICGRFQTALDAGHWEDLLQEGRRLGTLLGKRGSDLAGRSSTDPALVLRLHEDVIGLPWEIVPTGDEDGLIGEVFEVGPP